MRDVIDKEFELKKEILLAIAQINNIIESSYGDFDSNKMNLRWDDIYNHINSANKASDAIKLLKKTGL